MKALLTAVEPLRSERHDPDAVPLAAAPRVNIGIDPGVNTGIAWQIGKQPMKVATMAHAKAKAFITELVRTHGVARCKCYMEDPRQNKPVWGRANQNHAAMLKIAKNVGYNLGLAAEMEQHLKTIGISPMLIRPQSAKWSPKTMESMTGITRSSQHSRDAAKLIIGRNR